MTTFLKRYFAAALGLVILAFSGCKPDEPAILPEQTGQTPPLFTLLSPGQTGVGFNNALTEGLNTNILMYEYFYNGGGVATGDLNGDGLIDIYFTANMGENKLYLNQGDLQFKEATAAAGLGGRPGPWKTGVAIVDINGDNKLDLYVSYSGMLPDPKRVNQLFINQGNNAENVPTFAEKAAEYGLASAAFSNQAYFFDYDRDGDLDALLLNHNPKSLPVLNEVSTAEFLKKGDPLRGVRLYRQDNGRFEDVTESSGVSGSALTYGLGLGISDVNDDGWPDFYISNDYAVPDYLYINNRNGTFTNKIQESIGHNSHFSMGNDVGDVNNDGLPDIVTLDMLPEDNYRQKLLLSPDNYAKFDLNVRSGFHYQYMRNMLQLNNGNGTFSEIGQLAGISNTDWSWAALLADYNNDGWKDLFVTNGYVRDYTNLDFIKYMDDYVQQKGRLVREEALEIISNMPASNVANYIFANENGRSFANKTNAWGLERPSNSNGAAYADLDNDGDLDLVVNNINQAAFIYRNEAQQQAGRHYLQVQLLGEGKNTQGIGAKVTLFNQGKKQSLEQVLSRGYLSAVSPVLHFGLGAETRVDSLVVRWNTGKLSVLTDVEADRLVSVAEEDAVDGAVATPEGEALFEAVASPISYQSPKNRINDFDRQPLLISELSFTGPCMAGGDLNGDGLEDVFVGGAAGQAAAIFLQQKNGKFIQQAAPALEADRNCQDAAAVIFDANGDGRPDLYVASGGYHTFGERDALLADRLYLNDGRANFSRSPEALPDMPVSKGCVAVHDVNEDGYPDLFVGGRVIPGRYPEPPESYLLINDGKGRFTNEIENLAPGLQKTGMVTGAAWADLDGDNKEELLVVGEWLPVSVFSVENGKLENRTLQYFDREYKGWWNTITVADVNRDQKPDLLIGNLGTNTQFRVSDAEPAELYFKDFDNNGSVDPLFCYYIQGKSYPYLTRDELLRQLGGLRSRYPTYESYAGVTMTDIFGAAELESAGRLEANHLETTLFLGGAGGKFAISPLPEQVQYAPVYTITLLDFNQDGHEDVLLCGNNNHAKLRLGRFDANYGILLKGDGQGGFTYIDQSRSGFKLRGDVRSVIKLDNLLLFGINEEGVRAYRSEGVLE